MQYNFSFFKEETKKVGDRLKTDIQSVSTGRANPAMLDGVSVESYGTRQPIKNVATIAVEDPRCLRVTPWDPALVKEIEKAILDSKLPVSVSTSDQGIRVQVPQLTEESKQAMVKVVRQKLEDARVHIRMERQKIDKDIDSKEKAKEFSEDDKFRAKEELQKITEEVNQTLEDIIKKKEVEIMTV